jgi:hypothetical protein
MGAQAPYLNKTRRVMSTNDRLAVYLDMVIQKYKEKVGRLYAEKAEYERNLERVEKEIWKTIGAHGASEEALTQLGKVNEDMLREAQMKRLKAESNGQ